MKRLALIIAVACGLLASSIFAAESATRTLIDLGTTDAVWLVTIKAGVITIEPVLIRVPGSGPVVPPDDTPPPPTTDAAKAFADAIAKVTEAGKVGTAATLKSMIDPIVEAARTGKLENVASVKDNLPVILSLVVVQKPDWNDFLNALKARLPAVTDNAGIVALLGAASSELAKVK